MPQYRCRFFYLNMDTTDIVTGRHLSRVPEAVEAVVESLDSPPTVVMICITCVDALLGTDMERVCRRAEERVSVPVRPCYMYALTREGRRPPMVHVRQSIYSMLRPMQKRSTSVNVLGFFAPLIDDCELYRYLAKAGVKAVREVSRCESLEEFDRMAEANFNLVVNPEARLAADDLMRRLGIPAVELTRLFEPERIRAQYQALGRVIGTTFEDEADFTACVAAREDFLKRHHDVTVSVGECANADPFELALALTRAGICVREVFGTVSAENFRWLSRLAELAPEVAIYSNMEPTMIFYDEATCPVDLAIGKDACWYHPLSAQLPFNEDVQPFGYAGTTMLYRKMADALEER